MRRVFLSLSHAFEKPESDSERKFKKIVFYIFGSFSLFFVRNYPNIFENRHRDGFQDSASLSFIVLT
jgi:hypothetical protein